MSFNDMKTDFQNILNRDDCSDTQAQTFLVQGMRRIQRDCRLPSMERTLVVTPAAPLTWFALPKDLIQPIDVIVRDQDGYDRALDRVAYRKLIRIDRNGLPSAYARQQTQMWIAGSQPTGLPVTFLYYGNFTPFASADAENELSASTPDLGVYAGLVYAAQAFQHPSADRWEQVYQTIQTEVIAMAIDLDGEGGPAALAPLYTDDC